MAGRQAQQIPFLNFFVYSQKQILNYNHSFRAPINKIRNNPAREGVFLDESVSIKMLSLLQIQFYIFDANIEATISSSEDNDQSRSKGKDA